MQAQDSSHPTGVNVITDDDGGNAYRARNRKAAAAIQMQLAGATLAEIAEVLGYSTERAVRVAVEQALEKELHEESKEMLRKMVGMRLNRLLRGVWPKATDEDSPEQMIAVLRATGIIDSYVKLYGLAAPTEVIMYNPAEAEIEKWVAEAIGKTIPVVEEGDIFGGEIVKGELA
jgi:hypothetical protein